MLRLAGFLVCATLEEADRLSHLVPAHLAEARAAPGCLSAEVWRSREDPARFAALYRFRDRGAWERHLAGRPASAWWQAVGPLADGLRLDGEGQAMPLRNRVLPTGEIVAHPGRGLFTGNRGRLAAAPGVLSGRRWTTRAWICCALEWRGRRRRVMQPGQWTELFFLDEAVALAAGHRPCGCCRRADYGRFRAAWSQAFGGAPRAPEMDAVLHAARLAAPERRATADLPDGTFIRTAAGAALLWRGRALAHDPGGYGAALPIPAEAEVLTPAPMRAVLAAGYAPVVHPSADEAGRGRRDGM